MSFVDLPTGIEMYYEVEGSGEPLLLIMGTAADHSSWSAQVAAYRDHYSVITYDARGTGQSTHPPDLDSYSMAILADDASALLDHLGIETAHVSGLSLGSATAQELAIKNPDQISSLQLHCTWGRSDEWFIRMIDTDGGRTASKASIGCTGAGSPFLAVVIHTTRTSTVSSPRRGP